VLLGTFQWLGQGVKLIADFRERIPTFDSTRPETPPLTLGKSSAA
jgi:hypothetical protein